MIIESGLRFGTVIIPPSKSHEHRLLIADFLAGDYSRLIFVEGDNDDIVATKRCLQALLTNERSPILDCGESGSTRRFLAPIAAALGKTPIYKVAGRLTSRPMLAYPTLAAGVHELAGNISSQFVTGLLFALPLLEGDSEIRFTTPLESAGYVELTLQTLQAAGIKIERTSFGFKIFGKQRYRSQRGVMPEGDWSSAAFWVVANALGNRLEIKGLNRNSVQPDRQVEAFSAMLSEVGSLTLDVAQSPDIFPILAVQAAAREGVTRFVGTRRLRLKESDRALSTATMLTKFGVRVENQENEFVIYGAKHHFHGGEFSAFGDHRLAMSIAIGATYADSAVILDDSSCVRKSYPQFFKDFASLLVG